MAFMKRNLFLKAVAASILLFSTTTFAQAKKTETFVNFSVKSKIEREASPYSWNFRVRKGAPNGPLVYVFPPMGQPTTYITKYKAFKPLFQNPDINVVILTTSLDEPWALLRNMSDELVNEILPQVESSRLQLTSSLVERKRIALGLSRGGFNAIQILLNNPGFFENSVLLSPFIFSYSFNSTDEEMKTGGMKWAEANGLEFLKTENPKQYQINLEDNLRQYLFYQNIARSLMSGGSIGDDAEINFDKNNPVNQAKALTSVNGLGPMIIYANRLDEYGFAEGTEKFTQILKEKGAKINLTINEEGDHLSEANNGQLLKEILNSLVESLH